MSKKRNNKVEFDVTGLSWQDVIKADPMHIKGISQKSLARATSRLVSAYNKRAKRLEQSGLAMKSPSYRGLVNEGKTRLSVKGKSYNELMSVYADAKRLLTERKTFSIAGTRNLIKDTEERIGFKFKNEGDSTKFWEAMDKLKEKGIGGDKRTSSDTQREVADLMFTDGMSVDDVLQYYGVAIENATPDLQDETEMMMGFGDEVDEDGEDGELDIFDDDEW